MSFFFREKYCFAIWYTRFFLRQNKKQPFFYQTRFSIRIVSFLDHSKPGPGSSKYIKLFTLDRVSPGTPSTGLTTLNKHSCAMAKAWTSFCIVKQKQNHCLFFRIATVITKVSQLEVFTVNTGPLLLTKCCIH